MTYFFDTPNFIYLLLGIGFFAVHCEKHTSRYPICWEALLLSSYCGFNIYSPISHLLEFDFPQLDPVKDISLLLKLYNSKSMTGSSYSQPQSWSVVYMIARKRPQSTSNLRPLEPLYKL